jgi:phage terminase small subunit
MGKAKHPHDSSRPSPVAVRRALVKGDMNALIKALSVRQKRFAEEYIIDFNGSAAVIRAGYSPNYSDRQAHLLLHHDGVAAYIDHLTRSKESKIVSVNPDYVIQQVTAIIGKDGAKDSDRLRGLELLARHLGMFIERTELTGKDGGPIEMQKVEEEAQSFVSILDGLRRRANEDKKDVTIV